ncbi:MAG: hypothetical protein AAGI52_16265 [Bacteroidota bacterium]
MSRQRERREIYAARTGRFHGRWTIMFLLVALGLVAVVVVASVLMSGQ